LLLLAALGSGLMGWAKAPTGSFASTRPAVRIEYWQRRLGEITARLQDASSLSSVRLVFLGDSITDFWTMAGNPWFPGQQMDRAVWDETFAGPTGPNAALNLGISGDRTEHVLHRLLPKSAGGLGELDAAELDPDYVVLMVGVNNTWDAEQPVVESVLEGIRAVVESVHARKPRARVILQSILPLPDDEKNRAVIQPVNRGLHALAQRPQYSPFTTYLELYPAFVDSTGKQIAGCFADGVHPNEAGYRIWRGHLLPALDRARAAADHSPAGR
jgi:lysophospholipase L1-like esterase